MRKLTLPWPPSGNKNWRKYNNRMVKAHESRNYADAAMAAWLSQPLEHRKPPLECDHLAVILDLYPSTTHKRDVDNFAKVPLDACRGLLYLDDSQITQLIVRKHQKDGDGARVEVTVCESSPHVLHRRADSVLLDITCEESFNPEL